MRKWTSDNKRYRKPFFSWEKVSEPSKNPLKRQKDLEGAALKHLQTFEKV